MVGLRTPGMLEMLGPVDGDKGPDVRRAYK